jgi:hypothetical protein
LYLKKKTLVYPEKMDVYIISERELTEE